MEATDNNPHLGKDTALKPSEDFKPTFYSMNEPRLNFPLRLISVEKKLPDVDQDVICWNGEKLVAAKYVKRNVAVSQDPLVIEEQGQFQVEKYPSSLDRSIVMNWTNVTHWMPAKLK